MVLEACYERLNGTHVYISWPINSKELILQCSMKLQKEKNLSIIFISHNINLVAQISDRIAVMYKGQIIETGTPEQIIKNPQEEYTQKLVSSLIEFGTHYTDEEGGQN